MTIQSAKNKLQFKYIASDYTLVLANDSKTVVWQFSRSKYYFNRLTLSCAKVNTIPVTFFWPLAGPFLALYLIEGQKRMDFFNKYMGC